MNWKYPAFLWLGFSILPVLAFYFLRMRFRRHPVSSIYIWSRIQSSIQGGNKLRQRSILLLLFQLLAVAAAVMAVAQPIWASRIRSQPSILYLVDRSASMSATDLSEVEVDFENDEKPKVGAKSRSRLDAAKDYLTREIRKLSPGTVVMVFGCASGIEPLGNPTNQYQKVIHQLKEMQPSYAAFAEDKVAGELQSWLTIHKRAWRVVLITDGGLDLGGERLAVGLEGMLQTKIIGKNGNNLGVTALRVEYGPWQTKSPKSGASDSGVPNVGERFGKAQFMVHNGWPTEQKVEVTLYEVTDEDDDLLKLNLKVPAEKDLPKGRLTVPPGNTYQTLEFISKGQPALYTIQLKRNDQKPDQLAADDAYSLAASPPRKIKVLTVGSENPFLKAALDNPQLELSQVDDFPPVFTGEGWDLVIVDQKQVPHKLSCNLLTFNTTPVSGYIQLGAALAGPFDQASFSHPLLRYIDWRLVETSGGFSLTTAPEAQVLATVGNQPVLAAWEEPEGWRRVIFGTDLYHSNLGISGAFPIFMANLLQWIVPQFNNPLAYTLNVGEPVTLAEPSDWLVLNTRWINGKGIARILEIENSNGLRGMERKNWKAVNTRLIKVDRHGGAKGPLVTLTGLTPGVFQWGRGRERGIITVNTVPGEMNIAPQPLQLQQAASHTTVGDFNAQIPLEAWMLALLLLSLLAEWALWRGIPLLK